jgi:hypothetical protein
MKNISEKDFNELFDTIINKCESLNLTYPEIIDGLSRSLLGSVIASPESYAKSTIEGHGTVEVRLSPEETKNKLLKNASVLMSEKNKTKEEELIGEKKKN